MEYFIGSLFDSSSVHFKKIESYKVRFDQQIYKFNFTALSLLPPFELSLKSKDEYKRFTNNLSELIDDHLFGMDDEMAQFEFNGVTFNHGKKAIIGLKITLPMNFEYLIESLYSYLKEENVRFKKNQLKNNLFLPIGRIENADEIEEAINVAKIEFETPFVLNAKKLVLFEKNNFNWNQQHTLFENKQFSHSNFVNQLWAN